MSSSDRQKRIGEFLRPLSVHHGQLETYLIAVSPSETVEISLDRRSLLRESLEQQQSNLIPLIVRRTDAYEEEEYEVVYGAEWYLVAKELNIERLWVWVFDLTDEQANFLKSDMEQLLGIAQLSQSEVSDADPVANGIKKIENLIRRSEATLEQKLQEKISTSFKDLEAQINSRFLSENSRFSLEITHALEKVLEQRTSEPLQWSEDRGRGEVSYKDMTLPGLKEIAKRNRIEGTSKMKKEELIKVLQKEKVSLLWTKS